MLKLFLFLKIKTNKHYFHKKLSIYQDITVHTAEFEKAACLWFHNLYDQLIPAYQIYMFLVYILLKCLFFPPKLT